MTSAYAANESVGDEQILLRGPMIDFLFRLEALHNIREKQNGNGKGNKADIPN